MAPLPDSTLDTILAVQLTIAWAGEGRCQPRRLGWWETDLVDEAGGGDLLARLLPRTHRWASLEAVRSLFFLGFDVDEQLDDRLGAWKRDERAPAEALPLLVSPGEALHKDKLAAELQKHGEAAFDVVPGGRQLKGPRPAAPEELVRKLASALVPFADQYPLPFYSLVGAETAHGRTKVP